MIEAPTVRVLPLSEWPRGVSLQLAALSWLPAQLQAERGIAFQNDFDDLDYFLGAVLRLRNDDVVVLQHRPRAPLLYTTLIVSASAKEPFTLMDAFLADMRLSADDLIWVAPLLPQGWALWRQDDNGHNYLVKVYADYLEAVHAQKAFEAHLHKQFYWVVPHQPPSSPSGA